MNNAASPEIFSLQEKFKSIKTLGIRSGAVRYETFGDLTRTWTTVPIYTRDYLKTGIGETNIAFRHHFMCYGY